MQLHLRDTEGTEDGPEFAIVVDRQQELALDLLQQVGHLPELLITEIESVQLLSPVRRIKIKQGRRPIISAQDVLVRQILNLDVGESLMRFGDNVRHP